MSKIVNDGRPVLYTLEELHKLADKFSEIDEAWEADYKGAFNFLEWLKERESK